MHLAIDPEMQRLIDEKLRTGQYRSAEDVVRAGLAALKQQDSSGDFHPGELDAVLAEGERSITEHGTLNADEALRARRERRANLRPERE